jgi:hypothetical protein
MAFESEVAMLRFAFLAAAGISLAVPAAAQTTTVDVRPVQAPTANSDVNKLICKKQEEIGSRLGAKKVCLTQKQWQERALIDREDTERIQQNTGTRSGN